MDNPKITRYYRIILHLHLTSDKEGTEKDYMDPDLIAEFARLGDPLEFEILSHDAIGQFRLVGGISAFGEIPP